MIWVKKDVYVRDELNIYAGHEKLLLSVVKHRKLACFVYVTRHVNLSKVILQETVSGKQGRGRQRK